MLTRSGTLLFTAIAVPALLMGCGGGGGGDTAAAGDAADGGGADAGAATMTVDPAEAATISGMVMFEGTPTAGTAIDMSDEPTCAEKHDNPMTMEAVVSDGHLANVFVYVKSGLSGDFPASGAAVVLDQNGCMYVPHVVGIQAGQDLTIRNSDGLLHNINTQSTANRSFNISQPRSMESTKSFKAEEVMIPVKCDVHGWMTSYIGVVGHPYFAVTGADGSYSIPNLPPGDYTIEAWHEVYGVQTMQVTVGAQETGDASFTYNESMAGADVPMGEPIILSHAGH